MASNLFQIPEIPEALRPDPAILEAEKSSPGRPEVEQAWEHLLLSHNSDGRIGYWHSEWNPGEHKVAPSRRAFVEDNLRRALKILGKLG